MKKVILTFALLWIVIPYILQHPLNLYVESRISAFNACVNVAKEQAKQEGYFTEAILDELKDKLEDSFGVDPEDLVMDVTTTPKYRTDEFDERELIHYRISIPIEKVVAAPALLGISNEDNRKYYTIDNYTASEKVLE